LLYCLPGSEITDLEFFFEFIIDFFSKYLIDRQIFDKLMKVLILTQKGLTFYEIQQLTSITDEQWAIFVAVFKIFLLKHKEFYLINNNFLKKRLFAKLFSS